MYAEPHRDRAFTLTMVRRPNVYRLSCGEAPRACGCAARRLQQVAPRQAAREHVGRRAAGHSTLNEALQRRARQTARRQLLAGVSQRSGVDESTAFWLRNGASQLTSCLDPRLDCLLGIS